LNKIKLHIKKIFGINFPKVILCTSASILFINILFAQKTDTLTDVKVTAVVVKNKATYTTPLQELNATQLQKTNTNTVAEAIKQFAGVQVKDYGGAGGLKTVSVRSLGANHTGILYDGINVNDAQGGQIDLSKFSLDNVERIQLYNSNPTEILLPAKAYSYASILTIKTSSSVKATEKQLLKIRLQQSSFGYFSPSFFAKKNINDKLQMAINASYLTAKNQYPFASYEITNTTEKRKNSDITSYRVEYDIAYFKSNTNKINFKTYYYKSTRGLPGSIIFYNNTSNQRLDDENFFTQVSWQNKINNKHSILLNGKYNTYYNYYIDPSYLNSLGVLQNKFLQKELYFSAAYKYNINNYTNIAFASDFVKNKLKRTDIFAINFADPSRNTFYNNLAFKIKKQKIEFTANLLHTSIADEVVIGNPTQNLNKLTPAASANYKPFDNKEIYIRAFYKNIFRAPTFNDLYYTNIGNTNLKPENANQFNIGTTFTNTNVTSIKKITITTDFYANKITDKIIAVPRQNLFQWSMQNIGIIKILGVDATAFLELYDYKNFKISTSVAYTYQQAKDVTDKNTTAYNTQLPYTPMHSGSVNISIDYKKVFLNYNFIGSSLRYKQGDAIPENTLNPWSSHDISFGYTAKEKYKIVLDANNILNKQYEIIKFYPMPKFNYSISLTINLKNKKYVEKREMP
jgi:vitamin B12 transporter